MNMNKTLLVAATASLLSLSLNAFVVDDKLPAGNIIVDKIEGDVAYVHQDQRGTTGESWFYWAFRVTGAAGKTVKFVFTDGWGGGPVGVRGPVVSTDGGKTFSYPLDGKSAKNGFTYAFPAGADEVRFYECHPYLPDDWNAFLASHAADRGKKFETGVLCKSRKGADVPNARFGCLKGAPKYRIFMSSRHHCSESVATFVLEGFAAAIMKDDDLGKWFCENVEVMMVPFVDYDGAAAGDQGKKRAPHDHNRDYDVFIYPETKAIADWIGAHADNKLDMFVDVHCPWIRGNYNEFLYTPWKNPKYVPNIAAEERCSKLLEKLQCGSIRYKASDDLQFGVSWNKGANYAEGKSSVIWAAAHVKGLKICRTYEVPFANANGAVVTPDVCRDLGRDLAKVYRELLSEGDVSLVRPPAWFEEGIIYQISLRTFTRGGNFAAATEMLEHVRDTGANIVYLTPFVEMDRDMDRTGWSPRQIASGYETPKNPYRISDYNKVDPEYGTDADVKAFVDKAHALGLKVMFDLVYLHCGPNNVIIKDIPDAFQRNPDGSVKMTIWHFPYINYASKGARAYLIDNMVRFIRDFDVDGFRCDVGDQVPEEFWHEAFTHILKIKPDFATLNEGERPSHVQRAFQANYNWNWSYAIREAVQKQPNRCSLANRIRKEQEYAAKCPKESLFAAFLENHDIATDDWTKRLDSTLPVEAVNAAFAAVFLSRAVPVIWNGNEIADGSKTSFFGPVEHPARIAETINWEKAVQPAAQKRMVALRELARLRREVPAIGHGTMEFLENDHPEDVLTFAREVPGCRRLVAINLSANPVEVKFADRKVPLAAWEWKVIEAERRRR